MMLPQNVRQHDGSMWFFAAFSAAVLTAFSKMSHMVMLCAPKSIHAMDRMPLPQPKSSTRSPPFITSSSVSITSFVVWCCPVPKVEAGSISRMRSPAAGSTSSHEGFITRLLPTRNGL